MRRVPEGLTEGTALEGDLDLRCQVLVVGTGAGGPAAALAMAEAGLDVVMLEEGGWYPPEEYRHLSPLESFRKLYRDYGMTTAVGGNLLKDPAVPFPLGKAVGGTTLINSGTCFRTPDKVIDLWNREFGLELDGSELDARFSEVEEVLGIAPAAAEVLGRNAEIFAEGAAKLGWPGQPLRRNAPGCRGSGRCVFGCPADAKQGTNLSYVPRALQAGARLFTDVRVDSLLQQGDRVQGVAGVLLDRARNVPRGKVRVEADVVVVAAGAVGSPVLLQRSRIATGNAHLGANLRLHPGIRVAALMNETVQGWKGVPQGYYVDRFWEEFGIMFEGIFVPPGVALPVLPGVGHEWRDVCKRYPELATFGAMVKDTSSGTVRWRPGTGADIRYSLNRTDTIHLVEAVKRASEIYFAAGAERVFPAIYGFSELRSVDEVRKIDPRRVRSQHLEMMAFHPMGTVRMAARPEQGVLDASGRVHAMQNLYVADASIFPTCLGVNPMQSIMAFAAKIGRGIADRLN